MNEDLFGYVFTGDDGEEWVVVGNAPWSSGQYVEVERVHDPDKTARYSCRAASLVRRSKELSKI